jgi:hypothetical protein
MANPTAQMLKNIKLKDIGNKNFIALSERAWKNKPIGRLLLYSISSGSEVICKNV